MPDKILLPQQVQNLIAQGKAIVIYKDYVLNLTPWLRYHPGGDKAVYHMVGRDATDEMLAYHGPEAIEVFHKWKVGRINYPWKNLLPPIQGAVYSEGTKVVHGKDGKLGELLDDSGRDSSSSVELSSASSSELDVEEATLSENYHKSGYPPQKVTPVVPQNVDVVSFKNVDEIFPVDRKLIIVDPKEALTNYDNELSRRDMISLPSLDYETQTDLRNKYNQLHAKVIKAGLYQCDYWNYVREVVKLGSLALYSFSFLHLGYYTISAVLIAMAWHQGTFIAHDAGHVSITHNYQFDNVFGMFIAAWCGGLSLGWWKRNHNVHHLITNDPVHDPDIQHLPFFAVSVRLFNNVYSTYYDKFLWFDAVARKMIPFQEYLYYPILAFGRFNLYRLLWTHVLMGEGPRHGSAAWFRWFELAGLSFFFYWFFYIVVGQCVEGGWNKLWYVMASHICTMLVHVQITLSHFAMSTADLGVSESFASRQLRTTMDVDCPQWLDFLHGGLQFQAIHHLFPRMPRHNLRAAQPYVLDFCKEVGLPYSIYGFGKGNQIIISKLGEIGKQCSIMLDCTRKLLEEKTPVTEMI